MHKFGFAEHGSSGGEAPAPVVRVFDEKLRDCTFRAGRPVIADEGPEHLSMRVPGDIINPAGTYCGDYIQEISHLPGGLLLVGLGVRLHGDWGLKSVRQVGFSMSLDPDARPVGAEGKALSSGRNSLDDVGDWVLLRTEKEFLGVYWGRDLKAWCDPLGGEGLWPKIGDGKTAPFFHGWENYLRQWKEPRGWRARDAAGLVLGDGELSLCWHTGSDLPVEPVMNFSGAVALVRGDTEKAVRNRLEALAAPLAPEVDAATVSGFDYLEGSYRLRRTGGKCRVSFPSDPLGRRALVRVDGAPSAALACQVNGERARPQLVSVGRVDDPYGPHEGRPDSNGRPVLAARERPAERVELGVQLSPREPTVIEVAEAPGVSLTYLAQDEGRELLLFSSEDKEAPLGRISLADLKLRDLRLPGAPGTAAAIVPLYWFMMNAPSRNHSANLLEAWDLLENGPEAVRLRLAALNPGGQVRSTVEMKLSAPSRSLLRVEVSAKLEVLSDYAVSDFQFCNLFPEPSRQPGDWKHAETLAASAEDMWLVENRKPSGSASTAEGKRFRDFRPPFFLSQYASESGNFALLVTSARPAGAPLGYELCRCWLDNHLFVAFPEGRAPSGTRYEVDYQLAVWGGSHTTRDEVKELARASLASGRLDF